MRFKNKTKQNKKLWIIITCRKMGCARERTTNKSWRYKNNRQYYM